MMSETFIAKFPYIFFCPREISDYFGVASRLYLFIHVIIIGATKHVQSAVLASQAKPKF